MSSRARPFLEGLKDVNELFISNYPHEVQLLSLRVHELINLRDFNNPFFREHFSPDFEHTSKHLKSYFFADPNACGPWNLEEYLTAAASCGKDFQIDILNADTYVDDKIATADVCLTIKLCNLPDKSSAEVINIMRWHKTKGVWLCGKSMSMRYALGI